jgi:hypothetical protein
VLVRRLKSISPTSFVVGVGEVPGADATVAADGLADLRDQMAKLLHDSGDHTHG